LVDDYKEARDNPDPPGSFDEFLTGEGHRQARALYTRYQQLRKDLVDMATKRRSLKAAEQLAHQIALTERDMDVIAAAKARRLEEAEMGSPFSDTAPRPSAMSGDSGYSSCRSPSTEVAESPSILKSESSTPAREQTSVRFV
ncbi:hypothetical protein FRC00_003952, partial [Tulasnella sp. 408]